VASSTNNRVYAIDGYTNKVNETIVTGNNSYSIGNFAVVAVNPTTDTVYVTNPDSNTVSIIDGKTNSVEKTVKVGNSITSLAVNPTTNKVYITNWDSNTVSIIDGKTNSVVADTRSVDDRSTQEIVVAGISVGNITVDRNPTDIAVNPKTNLLYISYLYDDVVDVIDELTLDIVKKFEEFHLPSNIDINPTTGKVYVTTWFGEFTQVIVINGYTHELIDQIPIGGSASDIAVNIDSGLAYVTNTDHNILSVINPHTNKLTAVIRYNINPSNSGTIECNGQNIKNNHIRYDVGTPLECRANPSTGFEFSSWSSDLISNLKDDNPINFAASKHGTLIANFIAPVQISVPWELIVGIIVSPIVGWFIPFFADRFRERSQRNIASEYITSIDAARKKNDTATLYRLKDEIQKKFAAGKIAESHYNMLEDRLK
jgi:YVTN family beta-propeller protein